MIARLLSLLGTALLLCATAAAGVWAYDVARVPYALPKLDTLQTDATLETGAPRQRIARPRRPAIYYAAITDRPLFSPDRRPIEPRAEPEERPVSARSPTVDVDTPEPPQLRVLGVMGSDDQNRALVSNAGGDPFWLGEGLQIGGWTVSAIGTDWLEISLKSQTLRIEMYEQ